ncbi:hypothetical protein [Streptomyces adelaidensis]|uniref:hypothetical protein n=1 Tax=Streptomyces adelaidensis TaxID=2796465 RepID=UPI00190644C6|nr:hypothetical protein [Streptomyces adelaidensis]
MASRINPRFAAHASPAAIDHAIREADAASRRYALKADALRRLLDARREQVAAGTWPSKDDHAQPTAAPSGPVTPTSR